MSHTQYLLPLHLLLLFLKLVIGQQSHVTIDETGGYSDLVIGISDDVTAEDGASLIPAIKELLTSASSVLHDATRRMAYFKQVTILVPSHWPQSVEYETASFETFATSDVRVDLANPLHGDEPQTIQPLACGQPGLYIHLTPSYLLQLAESSTNNFGEPAPAFVHHWARFRYGIFEEFGCSHDSVFPAVYRDEHGQLVPNVCSNQRLNGSYTPECEEDDEACRFLPNFKKNDYVTSSLASYYFFPNNQMFCDDSEEHKHNALAPNRHNLLCNHRSTWSVISSHKDFKNKQSTNTVVNPTFKIVQRADAIYSLVLDISGSMNIAPNLQAGNTRLRMLQGTVRSWLSSSVRLGSAVGLVTFSDRGHIVQPLVNISDEVIRQEVIGRIPHSASGSTCIGCGLKEAIADLKRFNNGPGGVIVLLTDGQENRSPYIRDVLPELKESKIRVIAIAFHTDDSPDLETVAKATGGKVFSVSTDAALQSLGSAFHEATTLDAQEYDLTIQVHDARYRGKSQVSGGRFRVDQGLGRDTKVEFVYLERADIYDIIILGQQINTSLTVPTTKVVDDYAARVIRFTFDQLEAGTYQYTITRRGITTQDIGVTVTSSALSRSNKPVIARAWIVQQKSTRASGIEGSEYVVFAEVKKGPSPVLNADIEVVIEQPNQKGTTTLLLSDKGIEPDVTRNDGIYTGFIKDLAEVGRYAVKVRISDDRNSAASLVSTGFTGSKCLPISGDGSVVAEPVTEPTGPFDRVIDVGAVQVITPVLPEGPPRVTDLRLVFVDENSLLVGLNWSAPFSCGNGNEIFCGNGTSYEIHYGPNGKDVINFNSTNKLNIHVSPSQFGEQVNVNLSLTDVDKTKPCYLAIKVIDSHKQTSKISNVLVVVWKKPNPTEKPVTVPTTAAVHVKEEEVVVGEKEDNVTPFKNTLPPSPSSTTLPSPPIGQC